MKIAIGNFAFAPGGDASPEDLALDGQYLVQEAAYLRAALETLFPRGNALNTLTFAITREHASYAAAQAFLIAHAMAMPTGGSLVINTEDFEGGVQVFTAAASAVRGRQGRHTGITTRHQYTILCGPFSGGSLNLPGNPTA